MGGWGWGCVSQFQLLRRIEDTFFSEDWITHNCWSSITRFFFPDVKMNAVFKKAEINFRLGLLSESVRSIYPLVMELLGKKMPKKRSKPLHLNPIIWFQVQTGIFHEALMKLQQLRQLSPFDATCDLGMQGSAEVLRITSDGIWEPSLCSSCASEVVVDVHIDQLCLLNTIEWYTRKTQSSSALPYVPYS